MARTDWYTINSKPDFGTGFFGVQKFDRDGEPQGEYMIARQGTMLTCTCPAGHKFCRHKQMLVRFEETKRVDSGWSHNFDANAWKEPINLEN